MLLDSVDYSGGGDLSVVAIYALLVMAAILIVTISLAYAIVNGIRHHRQNKERDDNNLHE